MTAAHESVVRPPLDKHAARRLVSLSLLLESRCDASALAAPIGKSRTLLLLTAVPMSRHNSDGHLQGAKNAAVHSNEAMSSSSLSRQNRLVSAAAWAHTRTLTILQYQIRSQEIEAHMA
jgi:hypothetical protein